jgi:uncharacterized integral membrane protein
MSEVEPRGRRGRATLILVLGSAALVLMLVFVLTNSQSVPLSIAFWDVSLPLWLLMIAPFLLGVLLGWATRWWTARR